MTIKEAFYCLINDHEDTICILVTSGDQDKEELIRYCKYAHSIGLRTCLYTSASNIDRDLEEVLDYCKVGPYIEECGGLDKPTTNQRLYRIWTWNNKLCSEDITYKFSKEYRFRDIAN